MAPSQYHRPETALTKARELIKCDKKSIALDILYDVMKLRRIKQWQKVLEELMMLFVELCVELRKNVHFRKVIYHFKNISVMENTSSLEQVVKFYINSIRTKTEEAQRESKTVVMDVEDLDVLETPESLMLNAVSLEDTQDRSSRTILMPWLKFLWDSYRLVLDLLRGHTKLERLYHEMANEAYDFCVKYGRRTEFRKLSELIRLHTQKVQNQSQSNAPNIISLNNPETQVLHFGTRLRQLDCAMELEMYNEAFKTVEDIWSFILLSKKVTSAALFTGYYSKAAELFLRCGCHLYHAAALHKLMKFYRDHKKNVTREELTALGSKVVSATLAVPLPNTKLNSDKFLSGEFTMTKQKTLAGLLGLIQVPTRQSLIHDIVRQKFLNTVPVELSDLYKVLEADFQPLSLWERAQPALKMIEDTPELKEYTSQLHEVIVSKTILQLSQVYQSVKFERIIELCPFIDSISLERCILDLIHNLELPIRINHRLQAVMFDEFTDLGISQCEYSGQLVSQATHVNAPDKLSRQLTIFAQVMQQITEMLDEGQAVPAYRRALAEEYRKSKRQLHMEVLHRADLIEMRKEQVEMIHKERDEYFMNEEARRQAEEEQQLQLEERNLEKEAEERERQKTEDEQARLKRRIARGNYNLLMEHKLGVKLELTEEQLDQFDADKILEKRALEVKKKRKETAEKAKTMAKKLDYYIRAIRLEEIPLLEAAIEPEAQRAREQHEKSVIELEEHSRNEHARQLKERNRLIRMKPEVQTLMAKLKEARDARYQVRLAEWEELCDKTRLQRLAELKAKRDAEAAAEAERLAQEEEERQRAAEQAAELERIKQEKRAKEAEEERLQAAKAADSVEPSRRPQVTLPAAVGMAKAEPVEVSRPERSENPWSRSNGINRPPAPDLNRPERPEPALGRTPGFGRDQSDLGMPNRPPLGRGRPSGVYKTPMNREPTAPGPSVWQRRGTGSTAATVPESRPPGSFGAQTGDWDENTKKVTLSSAAQIEDDGEGWKRVGPKKDQDGAGLPERSSRPYRPPSQRASGLGERKAR